MVRQQLRERDYTTGELAEEAGVTAARIRQLILEKESGPFPGAFRRDWQWFIPGDEAENWLAARRP